MALSSRKSRQRQPRLGQEKGGEIPQEIISSPGKLPRVQKSAKTKGYRPRVRAPVCRLTAGWLSTVAGLGAMVFVPPAWVGLAPDVFIQLINSSGDTGRQTLANLAGAVSEGGIIAITEQVAKTPSGSLKFEWIYLYQANLNGMTITTPLLTCSTDVIVENPSPNPPNILWPAQW